ncbi:barstar family protein [Streptomyces sp. NBC_00237]|uniref:barstar family protein n=1 Tax=Streptomyces sp. NBC_00237 TaxID=2975687 RepID=UPI002B1D96D6|nr:barstar family protein [Streptomyces sp. NBC_00237]
MSDDTLPGPWTELSPEERRTRLADVQARYFARPGGAGADKEAGRTYALDGRHITDRSALFLALGEAVNGPGGYFGGNLDALSDCLSGGFGVTAPFVLEWGHSDVARTHLVAYFDSALDVLREHAVEVRLR